MSSIRILVSVLACHLAATDARTAVPFCSYCHCQFESGDGVSIDCVNSDIRDFLYDPVFWEDEFNNSYVVLALRARNSNIAQLSRAFPPSTLRILDLSRNAIDYVADGAFRNLQNMQELNLANNSIDDLRPDVFKGMYWADEYYPLKALKTLNLRHNKLTSLYEDTFEHVDKLETVYLGGNPLFEIDATTVTALASLPFLKLLDLSEANLRTLPEGLFQNHGYLHTVDLTENGFVDVPHVLGELQACEVLFFDTNPVKVLNARNSFPQIRSLTVLHVSGMPYLEEVHEGAFGGLKYLEELYMHDNVFLRHIQGGIFNGDEELAILPELEILNISNNNLSFLEFEMLPNWGRMNRLDLSGNPWSCDCRNQWIIDELVGEKFFNDNLQCSNPTQLRGVTFEHLKENNTRLECLSTDNNSQFDPTLYRLLVLGFGVNVLLLICCVYCKSRRTSGIVYMSLRNLSND